MSEPAQAATERVAQPAHLAARVHALEQRYREIAATRMAGVALCHPALEVAAVDFAPEPGGAAALGALVTPWFMNLVWLPLPAAAAEAEPRPPGSQTGSPTAPTTAPTTATTSAPTSVLPVGASRKRAVGPEVFEFIGAHESGIGDFEACSLFSPMFEFADQAAAVETARAALRFLREPAERPAARAGLAAPHEPPTAKAHTRAPRATTPAQPGPTPPVQWPTSLTVPAPARRAFLLGRGSQ